MSEQRGVLAVDVGSSRLKLGWFAMDDRGSALPEPTATWTVDHDSQLDNETRGELSSWLTRHVQDRPPAFMSSVRPSVAQSLQELLDELGWHSVRQLSYADLPLEINVDFPERVGIDRLLDAVGVNRLREENRSAIVVDLGTAGTVDLVSAEGTFQGGAILPGMLLAGRALHGGTASLPELSVDTLGKDIPAVGKNTEAAILSGVFWGAVGAINELIARAAEQCQDSPQLFVTGGAAASICAHLESPDGAVQYLPHLVLSSICIVAEESK